MNILYEDNHLLVINKACGEIVQGDKSGDVPLIDEAKKFIKERDDKPGNVFMGLPHRLDRPTSGALVLTKTTKALSRMAELFREKDQIKKIYWAVMDNPPPEKEGILEHQITKNEKQNKSYAYDVPQKGTKPAKLKYKLIASSDRYHLIEVELITGRHHQIRAQFAKVGCRIKGDLKYGFPRSNRGGGIHLHARALEFTHPIKQEPLKIVAPPPKDPLWDYFAGVVEK